jgi:hypothetical protein
MPKQERRLTKAEIETRRWQIGTAIGVFGLILAAIALWLDQDPKPVIIAPPPLLDPNNFQPEAKPAPNVVPPPSGELEPLQKNATPPKVERIPFSVPLEAEERETIMAEIILDKSKDFRNNNRLAALLSKSKLRLLCKELDNGYRCAGTIAELEKILQSLTDEDLLLWQKELKQAEEEERIRIENQRRKTEEDARDQVLESLNLQPNGNITTPQ